MANLDALLTLDHPDDYARWRDRKLAEAPWRLDELIVEVRDPRRLTSGERNAIIDRCRRANMAIYVSALGGIADKVIPHRLGEQLGLLRLDHNPGADADAITSVSVQSDALHRGYIPYTDRPLAWHTDGYYNDPSRQINAFILHCVQPAADGGINGLIDPEMLYIRLREQDPEHIGALTDPTAMTIPANIVDGVEVRPPSIGPVFRRGEHGRLALRYSDRRRNIEWRDDPATKAAVDAIRRFLDDPTTPSFRVQLDPGCGIVCNNVLHSRSRFRDDARPGRLLYRARYYERIAAT
ncbi:TauD/TfdA family dioxygenase [Halochromatium glycolicum]|uniref:Taurine catabolism dioxygenase TauD n=1 Tax=Halochromatium glycolicum TaxID=85075 RepID=A0AAJ0XBU1_9GAMM|nr:TauD/TfdA family dioxygenase [Halochromatium glycolicum]MBK1706297.1 taurine catabolism dioxygenase TauD [Halochromatium glycolicum]